MSSFQSVSCHDYFVNPDVLISERPNPLARAEAIKSEYAARLDAMLTEYERELTLALNIDTLSPAYQLAELAGYFSRLSRVVRRHEQRSIDRAAAAELAERSQAWTKQTQGGV
jgi:hypothetical protein